MPASQRPGCIIFHFHVSAKQKRLMNAFQPAPYPPASDRAFPEFEAQGTTAWTGVEVPIITIPAPATGARVGYGCNAVTVACTASGDSGGEGGGARSV